MSPLLLSPAERVGRQLETISFTSDHVWEMIRLLIEGMYLDFCPASQLQLIAEIKLPKDLHCTLVDVDPLGCSKTVD